MQILFSSGSNLARAEKTQIFFPVFLLYLLFLTFFEGLNLPNLPGKSVIQFAKIRTLTWIEKNGYINNVDSPVYIALFFFFLLFSFSLSPFFLYTFFTPTFIRSFLYCYKTRLYFRLYQNNNLYFVIYSSIDSTSINDTT